MTNTAEGQTIRRRVADAVERVGVIATFHTISSGGVANGPAGNVSTEIIVDYAFRVSPLIAKRTRYREDVVTPQDSMLIIPAQNILFTPVVGMQFTINSEGWSITEVKQHDFADVTVAWECSVRKGRVR